MVCFKEMPAYELRMSGWSSDVCSADLWGIAIALSPSGERIAKLAPSGASDWRGEIPLSIPANQQAGKPPYLSPEGERATSHNVRFRSLAAPTPAISSPSPCLWRVRRSACRSEEHTSELQSLMRISYAVFCLKQ